MKTYPMIAGLVQKYENYTPEDFAVWKILFERQMTILPSMASEEYLEGIQRIGFTGDTIPNFQEVNARLLQLTGWKIVVVPGIIEEPVFFQLLSQKKFPATSWLRKMNELDYLSEPDMFHDVFGHMPLLTNPLFCDFYHAMGMLGVTYNHKQNIIQMLGRMYWFTVEFGLIKNNEALKIFGAGILSSHSETKFSVSDEPKHIAFNTEQVMHTPYENDHIQDTYFVIDSFQQLYNSIEEMKRICKIELDA